MNDDHGKSQAQAQYESIQEMLEQGDTDAIQEDPLEVQVRADWHTPGTTEDEVDWEYSILLCTGGPAVRITGDLNRYKEPCTAQMEYQDWGTPWNTYYGTEESVLIEYAANFYYGG